MIYIFQRTTDHQVTIQPDFLLAVTSPETPLIGIKPIRDNGTQVTLIEDYSDIWKPGMKGKNPYIILNSFVMLRLKHYPINIKHLIH